MYILLGLGVVSVPLLSVLVFKTVTGSQLSLNQIAQRAYFLLIYYVMGVRENVEDIINRSRNKTELTSRSDHVAIVTGGARGLGLEVVKKLLLCDVCVIIGCRNVEAGEKELQKIENSGVKIGNSKCYKLDVASLASIKQFSETVLRNHSQINIIVNNAGMMVAPYSITEDGFESQFATNYIGHFYLTHLLLPRLISSARACGISARVVNVSSCIHYMASIYFDDLTFKDGYMDIMAYGQSKLAQILFTKSLDKKLRTASVPVQVHAVHPGIVDTEIFQGSLINTVMPWFLHLMFKTPEEGARSILHASVSPRLAARGGTYITNCSVTPTGGKANSKEIEDRLWTKTLELLKLESFGGIAT